MWPWTKGPQKDTFPGRCQRFRWQEEVKSQDLRHTSHPLLSSSESKPVFHWWNWWVLGKATVQMEAFSLALGTQHVFRMGWQSLTTPNHTYKDCDPDPLRPTSCPGKFGVALQLAPNQISQHICCTQNLAKDGLLKLSSIHQPHCVPWGAQVHSANVARDPANQVSMKTALFTTLGERVMRESQSQRTAALKHFSCHKNKIAP